MACTHRILPSLNLSAARGSRTSSTKSAIRINPQRRDREPLALHDIDDWRNELSGNVSTNQELTFIQAVNEWCARIRSEPALRQAIYKEIDIYMITMAKQLTDRLDLGSKMNRDPVVSELREHGAERGRSSSISGPPRRSRSWKLSWPSALEGIHVCKSQRIAQRVPERWAVSRHALLHECCSARYPAARVNSLHSST